jgi:hypothetical protein
MTLALVLAVVAILAFNIGATVLVLRSPEYGPGQKIAQLFVVWLLPIIGAVIALHVLREAHHTDRRPDNPFVESGTGDYGGGPGGGGDGH